MIFQDHIHWEQGANCEDARFRGFNLSPHFEWQVPGAVAISWGWEQTSSLRKWWAPQADTLAKGRQWFIEPSQRMNDESSGLSFIGSVLWPAGWIIHPTASTSWFLGVRIIALLHALFGETNTHLLLPAGLTKPGYCHCKWFFSCVSTQKQKCLCESVCEKKTIFFASGNAAFPIAVPPVTERVFVCQGAGSSHPGGLSPIMRAPLQSLLSWDRQGSKAFPQGATKEQAWVFSSLCLKIMHCVFLPYIWVCFGLNSGGWHQFWSCSHSYMHTCVREGPEDSGSSNLIIQYCSVLFINQIAVLESWSVTGALHTETWKKKSPRSASPSLGPESCTESN